MAKRRGMRRRRSGPLGKATAGTGRAGGVAPRPGPYTPAVDLAVLKLALELHAVGPLVDARAVVLAALEVALVFGVVLGSGG